MLSATPFDDAYAGWGAGMDANQARAMANLGVNLVRRESEHYDVGVGLHADTGAEVSKENIKFYLFGLGGEAKFDAKGKLRSVGLGLSVFKLRLRSASEARLSTRVKTEPQTADAEARGAEDVELAV